MVTPLSEFATDTPSQPRSMWPLVRNWLMIGITSSLGVAKPMPTEPPEGETMAVLIADHLAVHVEDRAAGIARIDRCIELQEVVERSRAEIAAARRDDAGGDRAAETERIAGGEDPVADLDLARIAERHGGQRAGLLDLDQRHVGEFVGADDRSRQPRAVGQADHDLVGVTDHMVVGHDQP